MQIARLPGGRLDIHYFALGDVDAVRWPEACTGARADRLWENSCFEAFVQPVSKTAYAECNFSPSGAWAAYCFSDYRAGMDVASRVQSPEFKLRRTANAVVAHVRIGLSAIPTLRVDEKWNIGLSAVIEANDGTKSYWALKHPAGKPDFHHPDCFALTLEAPGAA